MVNSFPLTLWPPRVASYRELRLFAIDGMFREGRYPSVTGASPALPRDVDTPDEGQQVGFESCQDASACLARRDRPGDT